MIFNLQLITYVIGLSFLSGTCHAQGQAGLPTGGSDNTTNDRNSNGKLESTNLKVHLPSLTKIAVDIDNPKSDISGPVVFTQSFKFDESSGILNEWAQKEIWWKVYVPTAKEGELDDEKDLRFVMNCIIQGSSDSDTDQHTFKLFAQEPYLHPLEGDTWQSIINEANMGCPTGECVHKDGCEDLPMPRWDQMYLQEHIPALEDESGDGDGNEKEWYKKLSGR
ncbi:hypothetical protein V865_000612 [Kwoniella europaea PYCC6329]|uniref:Uncharacterized protein n=1 Tax=Kwoniella europaea PYCC6329 TaxID=1423913 RepID=A0AAX4KA22_9TREE